MNKSDYRQLKETSWRRELSDEEKRRVRRYLATHPEDQADWEEDSALSRFMEALPDIPAPSNFTSQILHKLEREQARRERLKRRRPAVWLRLGWLARGVAVAIIGGVAFFGIQQQRASSRAEIAQSVSAVSTVAAVSQLEWLQDFEAIHRLGETPPVDYELLALLE